MWNDGSGGEINSTIQTYNFAQNLLDKFGQGVLIAGRDRFNRELGGDKRFYAILECPDLFEGADIPSVLAFFLNRERKTENPYTDVVERAALPFRFESIILARDNTHYIYDSYSRTSVESMIETWDMIRDEYKRRYHRGLTEAKFSIDIQDGKIKVSLNPYQKVALSKSNQLRMIEMLDNQSAEYFALNRTDWNQVRILIETNVISASPNFLSDVKNLLQDLEIKICPLYPVKPQQRLGFLADVNSIKCKLTDDEKGFIAGDDYTLFVNSKVCESRYTATKLDKNREPYEVKKLKEWKMLEIRIGEHKFSETDADIQYIIDHFHVPDPGDVARNFPDEIQKFLDLLTQIEAEHDDWNFMRFQKDDLSRLLLKRGGLLSWEQGLGKTLGGLAFAEAAHRLGAEDKALFIIPQDLIPQWQREAKKFFDHELTVISNIPEARAVRDHLRSGGTGWYVTYYEAISRNGRKFELLPPIEFNGPNPRAGKKIYDPETHEHHLQPDVIKLHSSEFCPSCYEPNLHGNWNPGSGICMECGYKHRKLNIKAAYSQLTTAFKHGTVVIDEGTKIKSNNSLMSKSVRGIRAAYKLILTGTPIKNYIPDAFWLLWWSLGNASSRFPYDYAGGFTKFAKDFAVSEYSLDTYGSKKSCKILPEVANLSMLWRLLCSSIIRRRKEETGEQLVEKKLVPVICPPGTQQTEMYKKWLQGFTPYFCETHPESNIAQYPDLVERNAAILGQLWKLEFSSILPEAEPDGYYPRGSNWTPANLKVLELASEHAKKGDKVLIGSSLMAHGKWIADNLARRGIPAVHIVEVTKDGDLKTKAPAKRASAVNDFCNNGVPVLCASVQSMQLGHNLDAANVVIYHGLPWDYSSFDQFTARVHRLTSTKPVTIYVVMTDSTVDLRKWDLLQKKGAASELAIDGELFAKNEEQVPLQVILDELKDKGIKPDTTISENAIREQWLPKNAAYSSEPKSQYHEFYLRIQDLIGDRSEKFKKDGFIKLEASGFMNLNIDRLGSYRIAMAHNYIQNGDVCPDPDMEISINHQYKTARPDTYQDVYRFDQVDGDPNMQRKLDEFFAFWLKNLFAQGFARKEESQSQSTYKSDLFAPTERREWKETPKSQSSPVQLSLL